MNDLEQRLWSAVGTRALSDWGLFQLTAAVAATSWFFVRTPGGLRRLQPCLIAAFVGATVGAFALDPVLRVPAWLATGLRAAPPHADRITAYGALVGLTATYALLARARGVRFAVALDLLAPSLGLLVCFARLGCFGAGCDFGAPTGLPWAVRYPPDTPAFVMHRDAGWIAADAPHSLPVHPTQIYEAVVGLVMCAVALLVERPQRADVDGTPDRSSGAPRGGDEAGAPARGRLSAPPAGAAFAAVAATYAAGRALIDVFRGDLERAPDSWPTTAQWLGVGVLGFSILWATTRRRLAAAAG